MYIEVPENLARRIHKLAQGEDECLAELLGIVIDRYDANPPKYATLGDLQRHAQETIKRYETDRPAHAVETAPRGREVLSVDFADNLASRVEP